MITILIDRDYEMYYSIFCNKLGMCLMLEGTGISIINKLKKYFQQKPSHIREYFIDLNTVLTK